MLGRERQSRFLSLFFLDNQQCSNLQQFPAAPPGQEFGYRQSIKVMR
jgi:hypothetical protein